MASFSAVGDYRFVDYTNSNSTSSTITITSVSRASLIWVSNQPGQNIFQGGSVTSAQVFWTDNSEYVATNKVDLTPVLTGSVPFRQIFQQRITVKPGEVNISLNQGSAPTTRFRVHIIELNLSSDV